MEERLGIIQQRLSAGEAALIESEDNRFYLTGFACSDGFLIVTAQDARFYTDSRYIEKARMTVKCCPVELAVCPQEELRCALQKRDITRLYVETVYTSLRRLAVLEDCLTGITVSRDGRIDQLLETARSIKTPAELSRIRQAQALTDETFSYILDRIRPGRTEREVMLDMEFYIRRRGSEGVSFDFIVVSGANSSLPHGVPTDKPILSGDLVTMDFGAVVDGYRSDMTRTVGVGKLSEEQRRVYRTVLTAQQAALDMIRPGVSCRVVDKVARDLLDGVFPGCFGHGLGHGVGIAIHESPAFSPRCDTVLSPGMVLTVEPGIYLENRFGVRIEDMVLITGDGMENLTHSPKDLIEL